MKHSLTFAFLALNCLYFTFLPAQNVVVSYIKSDSLFVCNTDTFTIKVQNNDVASLTGAAVILSLPQGITYVAGTLNGGSQQNISNLSAPVFGLPDVPANQSATLKVLLLANCNAADLLDSAQLFIAQISLVSALGNTQVNTTSIPVETGSILIQSVTELVLAGERFDTLKRTICVKNSRLGKIGALYFEDGHLEGFEVSVAGSTNPVNGPTLFSADFEGTFFQNVGNGDTWLDLNESVCFEEQIILTNCGIPAFTNPSVLRVGWGCGGEVCRYDSATAFIEIKPSTRIPNLVFEQIWAPPTDYCGNNPAIMGYKIKNTGGAKAKDIFLSINLVDGLTQAGFLANSFKIVHNSDTSSLMPNVTTPTYLQACDLFAIRDANVVIPLLGALDSLLFLFELVTCVDPCEQVQPSFRTDYFYKKDCPANGFVSGYALILPEDGYVVRGDLVSTIGSCLESGFSYPFSYEAVSKYLTTDGFWHLELELPLGITLDDSCGTLLGAMAPILFETNPLPNGGQNIHLAWTTPMAFDSLAMNFCLRYECDTNIVCVELPPTPNSGVIYTDYCCFVKVRDVSYWSPELSSVKPCMIQECGEQLMALNLSCKPNLPNNPGDSTLMDPIFPVPGLRDWWYVYRTNLGYQDIEDNRKADLPLSAPTDLARRDRFLAGDTLRVEYCGVMDSATLVDTIARAIWHEIVGSDMGTNDNDLFNTQTAQTEFTDRNKVRWIGTRVRVQYADGTEAICDWDGYMIFTDKNYFKVIHPNAFPIEPLDDISTEKFYFLYSLPQMFAEGCLPKPELALGDSIFILTDFKLDVNFKPSSTNSPEPPLVGFRTATSGGGDIFAWNQQPHKKLQYSGWRKTITPNTHSIKPCENSFEVKKFRFALRIARENLFPFEVRPLAWISDYHQTVPAGLELASAKLEYLTLQDSVPALSNQVLPFSEAPGILDIDFAPAFSEPVDEGFTLRSQLIFKPDCRFNLPDTSKQFIETSFAGCLNGEQKTVLDSLKNSIGFFSNTPKLALLTADSVLYSPSRDFEINFSLKNTVISAAPAPWVSIVSTSGQASNFQLFQMPQNQALTGVNGLFNLNILNGFSQRSFKLTGQNIACETDTLLLIFGWACAPVSSLSDSDCGRDTFMILLNLDRPELELDVLQEPDDITLCDTSGYFVFEVYNAKKGYAYDLEASVKLPPGLRVVSGTCQISYPEGSPWINISDPVLLASNLFRWEILDILPVVGTNGLPGVDLNPQNTFQIRFKTLAECGFVANTPLIYGTTGVEPCGRRANVLNKPGEPLHIQGLEPSYGVQIGITNAGAEGIACGGQEFSVQMNLLGTASPGDSVYISLPQGVSLAMDSYVPGLNAPLGPPTLNSQGFQLLLPVLPGGSSVIFSFTVLFEEEAGCNDPVILVQTRVRTDAFCQSLGIPCTVFVATGEAIWNLNIPRAQWNLGNAHWSIVNGVLQSSVTVSNIGQVDASGVSVEIWRDTNGDGILSATDLLLGALQSTDAIGAGTSLQLTGLVPGLDSTQLCGLLYVLPAADNCACEDQVLLFEDLSLSHTELQFCALQPVMLGVPSQVGYIYQWQPATGIGCANCPFSTFTPDPDSTPNTPQTLTLLEYSGNCTITHTFRIIFGATASINTSNAILCEGELVTLTATPAGATYLWQGPGIQDPTTAIQHLKPIDSAIYSVSITTTNGCTATDSTFIEVLEADTLQISGLTTCSGEPVQILGIVTDLPGTYQQVFTKINGCDSLVLQTLTVYPASQIQEEREFCIVSSLLVYDSLFTESGSFCREYSTIHGCDSILCVTVTAVEAFIFPPPDTIYSNFGQVITLTGPVGYPNYLWEPAPAPPCPNCPVVTYTVDSSGYQEILLRFGDPEGCPGELVFRLLVFPPCSADSLKIPNAFTPNGDGFNDVFQVVKHEGSEVISSLEIYDRWGEKVYENQGNAFWDGTIRGKPAPSDVYVYIVTVKCGNLTGKRVGDVTLLR